jgi:hypothetical protein
MNKTQLAAQLTLWGLVVEGDETYDELYSAYKYYKEYRLSGAMPTAQRLQMHRMWRSVERDNSDAAPPGKLSPGWN